MKTKHILFLLLSGSLLLFTACNKENKEEQANRKSDFDTLVVPHSMKGYELYSWPEGNIWYFSVLAGTNRTKTYAEVISNTPSEIHLITVTGIETLKLVLDRFPENEDITWIGKGWLQSAWGSGYGNLQLPPQNNVDDITNFCAQKKLNLQVTD
jgi:hypothetical protein